ncbi:hypothetical protein T4B_13985 [Trichinella pseudospiralis]|uniref:Uncharacterized protein n=1 Tax=Trichinella pseudospiralis TaxID=6337 RepID=A0A0V1EG51_TRIPS|nr:hypothetical protein T4A_5377 [Trichinella pseudospiralis]KRZ28065.1 hypothetical protein T4B_13985 [Trichinella pseudospiralis]KRZ33663.1 hypothetical protein T4C_7997 [Trichinella pseudospiralis]
MPILMHKKTAHLKHSLNGIRILSFINGNLRDILVNLSCTIFLCLGNSIFLHFPSISIDIMNAASSPFQMCIKSSIY